MNGVLFLLLVWAAIVGVYLAAPRREVTKEQRYAKLREKSYARWYAGQLQKDADALKPRVRPWLSYTPYQAVNLLPYPQVER